MTQPECRIANARSRRAARLLAVVDGVSFGWFLILGHGSLMKLIQVAEFNWGHRPYAMLPDLTKFSRAVLPEDSWSLVTGMIGLSLGFGMISVHSNEVSASRLFRWAFIVILTFVVGVSLPIVAPYKNLSGGPDGQWWDEVLFVVLAASFVVLGIIRLRCRSSHRL